MDTDHHQSLVLARFLWLAAAAILHAVVYHLAGTGRLKLGES